MWKEYKAAIITGAVLCCIIFFGLGYCVGNSGRGCGGGIQNYGFRSMESGNDGMNPGRRNQGDRPDIANPQNPTDNSGQTNDDSQAAPDSNTENQTEPGNNGGSQTTPDTGKSSQSLPNNDNNVGSLDGTAGMSAYFFGGNDVF